MESITLLRHADSVDREVFHKGKKGAKSHIPKSDWARPLSKKGKRQSKAIARFLGLHSSFDLMICSVAKRTKQTLKPIKKRFSACEVIYTEDIAPGKGLKGYIALNHLPALAKARNVLLVGHQPDLELFAKWICPSFCFEVPKGVLIRFSTSALPKDTAPLQEGCAVLSYLIPPNLLRNP